MSDDAPKIRNNELTDLAVAAEEEARERSTAIVGSYLRNCFCVKCGAPAVATLEMVLKARCTTCLGSGNAAPLGVPRPVRRFGVQPWTITPMEDWHRKHPGKRWVPPVIRECECSELEGMPPLAAEVRELGWLTKVQHSHGTLAGARTENHVVGIRFAGYGRGAYAIRAGGTWKSFMVWGPGRPPFPVGGLTLFKEWLTVHGNVPTEWYGEIKAKRAASALATKVVRCPDGCTITESHTHRANGDVKPRKTREAKSGA